MSWRATAHVKFIRYGTNGELLTRTEKLVLMILADYHNDEVDAAFCSYRAIGEHALTTRKWVIKVTAELVRKGLLTVETRKAANGRENRTNFFRFPTLTKPEAHPRAQQLNPVKPVKEQEILGSVVTSLGGSDAVSLPGEPAGSLPGELAGSPKPLFSLKNKKPRKPHLTVTEKREAEFEQIRKRYGLSTADHR